MKRLIRRKYEKKQIIEKMVVSHFHEFPEDEDAIIEITRNKRTRSGAQNDLYWAWIDFLLKHGETGYTKDELHAVFKDRFLGYNVVKKKNGSEIKELRSTKYLKIAEFSEYLNEIDNMMSDMGIVLPTDTEDYKLAMGII